MSRILSGGLAVALSLVPAATLACSACGCTLTSDWIGDGLTFQPGVRAELRYDFIPQSQLRSGSHAVDLSSITLPADREIEKSTYNHYVTAGLDWQPSADWGINVQAPLVFRPHDTISEGDTDVSHSVTRGLGDVRVTARYQGFGGTGITGIQFGLKLPTGGFHTEFVSGPQAGEFIDRGLDAGTGTTDALLGAYHFGQLAGQVDWFAQAITQVPLDSRDEYKPGVTGFVSAGLRYAGWHGITPQLQLDLRLSAKDTGFNADHDNSGGELLYIRPGATVRLSPRASLFGGVQLPVYEHVNGFQLTPRVTASAGLQVRL